MPPTTSDRFFALAARVESALPDAGLTKEQAAELVGALRAYWEAPSEQALVALKATQERIINMAIREGRLNLDHNALSAHHALSRAAEAFFDNEPDTFIMDVSGYLDRCEHRLGLGGLTTSLSEHLAHHMASQSINPEREALQDARLALSCADDRMTREQFVDLFNNLRRILGVELTSLERYSRSPAARSFNQDRDAMICSRDEAQADGDLERAAWLQGCLDGYWRDPAPEYGR